jgi:hypothetical protein
MSSRVVENIPADASGTNVPALRGEACRAADILRFNVAGFRFDFDAVTTRNRDFKLHPELRARAGRVRQLRRERSADVHAGGSCFGREGVVVQQVLRQRRAGIRFDMHGVAHDGSGCGFEWNDFYGAEIRGETQSQAICGGHRAGAIGGDPRPRIAGLRRLNRSGFGSTCPRDRNCTHCDTE